MSTQVSQSNSWIQLQINVFTRWVQNELKNHTNIHIESITKDLSNGVALVELAKILTKKDTPRNWALSPKRTVEMVQNCDLAVDMFTKDGVNLVGISGKDVNDNNEKLILGLIWSLILKYSIGRSIQTNPKDNKENTEDNTKITIKNETKILKSWAIERTENYPNIHNFQPYELSMCALLDSYVPSKINYYSLNPNDTDYNSNLATNVMNELGIPILIYPEDVKNNGSQIDDKTLLTQLSTMKTVLEEQESNIVSRNKEIRDEKSDVESDDEFSNALFGENEINDESRIKSESADSSNQQVSNIEQPIIDDFANKLFEEYEFDQESIIKAEFAESSNSSIDNNNNRKQSTDNFSNTLFGENEFDQESRIKADSIEPISQPLDNSVQRSIEDFEIKLFNENSIDHELQIKTDSIEQQPEVEAKSIDRIPNNFSNHLNDHLIDHNFDLKVDSRDTKKSTKRGYYKLHSKKKFSFFDWLFNTVIKPVESLFKQPPENTRPYARVLLLNSPITPFYYYVDYARE